MEFSALSLPKVQEIPKAVVAAKAAKAKIIRKKKAPSMRVVKVDKKRFGNGQCTALLQAKGFNIHAGAARNWPTAAKAAGYTVNQKPSAGAAIVTKESSYGTSSGHVLYQEGPVTASGLIPVMEQNYVSHTVTHGFIDPTVTTVVAYIHK